MYFDTPPPVPSAYIEKYLKNLKTTQCIYKLITYRCAKRFDQPLENSILIELIHLTHAIQIRNFINTRDYVSNAHYKCTND